MLSIRFSRTGKKKQPYFRLLVTEKQKDPWGKYIELLGNYNPRTKEARFKEERIKYWLSVGAQATVSVHNLLVKLGIIEGKKKNPVKISHDRRAKLAKAKADAQAESASGGKEEAAKPSSAELAKAKAEEPQEETPAKDAATEPQPQNEAAA